MSKAGKTYKNFFTKCNYRGASPMKVNLSKLVDGCIDAHVTAATTKDAAKHFRALIQHAYDIGVKDGKEDIKESLSKSSAQNAKESDRGEAKNQDQNEDNRESKASQEGSRQKSSEGTGELLVAKTKAKDALANL